MARLLADTRGRVLSTPEADESKAEHEPVGRWRWFDEGVPQWYHRSERDALNRAAWLLACQTKMMSRARRRVYNAERDRLYAEAAACLYGGTAVGIRFAGIRNLRLTYAIIALCCVCRVETWQEQERSEMSNGMKRRGDWCSFVLAGLRKFLRSSGKAGE